MNFLDRYKYVCGFDGVPAQFNYWTGVALLAACIQRHTWVELIRGAPWHPNLYVMFIAKSGIGKGISVGRGQRILEQVSGRPWVYDGRLTGPAVYAKLKQLGRIQKKNGQEQVVSFLYITPELAESLRGEALAREFLTVMTSLWDSTGRERRDFTVTRGEVVVPPSYATWIAGTTMPWLRMSVGKEEFLGGTSRRLLGVLYDGDHVHVPAFSYPPNVYLHEGLLVHHLTAACALRGEFKRSEDADRLMKQWYNERYFAGDAVDERIQPFYHGARSLAWKLAMVHGVSRDMACDELLGEDVIAAQQDVTQLEEWLPSILNALSETKDTRGIQLFRDLVSEAPGKVLKARVRYKLSMTEGLTRSRLLELEQTLRMTGEITDGTIREVGDAFVWLKTDKLNLEGTDD